MNTFNPGEPFDIAGNYKKLLAENVSLASRLQEYATIIAERDKEIVMLQNMLTEATSHRSRMDADSAQFQQLQNELQQLHSRSQSHYVQASPGSSSTGKQLADLKQRFSQTQSQLIDMQEQLTDVMNRNILLQQQGARVSELESLLEHAQLEIEMLKRKPSGPGQPGREFFT